MIQKTPLIPEMMPHVPEDWQSLLGSPVCSLGHLYYVYTGLHLPLYFLKVQNRVNQTTLLLYSARGRPKLVTSLSPGHKMSGVERQEMLKIK